MQLKVCVYIHILLLNLKKMQKHLQFLRFYCTLLLTETFEKIRSKSVPNAVKKITKTFFALSHIHGQVVRQKGETDGFT